MTSPIDKTGLTFIPESAPFDASQRLWLNGYMAGLLAGKNFSSANNGAEKNSAPTVPLVILFGSQTGTAEKLAKQLAKESKPRGCNARALEANSHTSVDWSKETNLLVITSTYGDGDMPDNAQAFWDWLQTDDGKKLSHLNFSVLALGDTNYEQFCAAGKKIDARLEALGAKRIHPLVDCDLDYEAKAKTWSDDVLNKVAQASRLPDERVSASIEKNLALPAGAGETPALLYSRNHPFPAKLVTNRKLNGDGSQKETRHFEISLEGSGLNYEAGDALGVWPTNCPELVTEILTALGCDGEESVPTAKGEMPLRKALTSFYDLGKPTNELLQAIARTTETAASSPSPLGGERAGVRGENVAGQSDANTASNKLSHPSPSIPLPSEGRGRPDSAAPTLAALLAPERADDLKKWLFGRDVLDVLQLAPKKIPAAQLPTLLRKLAPRLYSISSSPKAHAGQVHLTINVVRYESLGRARKGLASTFLADRAGENVPVPIFFQPAHGFRLPANLETPVIMVGPGTGVAPFRSFLHERAATGGKGKNWLFFGEQRGATDFYYRDELEKMQADGSLTKLSTAFSRDQAEKIYVQTRMLENAAELWSWLESGAHFYVCGDASRMAKDVDDALHKIISTAGGKSADEAKAYVAKLKTEKRYQRDVY